MKFTAYIIEPSTNEQIANLLFADPETNPDEPSVFMLSRAIDVPDSVYYFEINDQSNSSYGGLESVHVSRNRLEVTLKRELVEKFGNEDFATVEVEFDADEEMYQMILDLLKKIFDGHNILEIE
ncbi:MAG TPA: Imm10 family immunity protein [Anaerolineales bacterium]|nr:Imm10 family immunity protein [Anaerolineales bacterium]